MNVVLNTEEVAEVVSIVATHALDHVPLSEAAKKAIREWRKQQHPGDPALARYAVRFNEALGNHIDERTTRMIIRRGQVRVAVKERTR